MKHKRKTLQGQLLSALRAMVRAEWMVDTTWTDYENRNRVIEQAQDAIRAAHRDARKKGRKVWR